MRPVLTVRFTDSTGLRRASGALAQYCGAMTEQHFDYVVVGGGIAGAAAVRGIRSEAHEGSIALISTEAHAPYDRPALSKALWRDAENTSVDTITLKGPDLPGVTTFLGRRAESLDTGAHTVTLDGDEQLGYRRLILATGGSARTQGFPVGERVIAFHDLDDYEKLRALADRGAHIIVAGGGFVGSELAAALAPTAASVTYLFPEDAVGARWFPLEITAHLDRVFGEAGIEVVPGARVVGVEDTGSGVRVTTDSGSIYEADAAVLGLGLEVDVELARAAGIVIRDGGIAVDAYRRTSEPDVWAAGDAVVAPDRAFGVRAMPHEDAAREGGRVAGRNAAGADVSDDHTPYFYSDLFDDGYEALGNLDPRLETIVDWKIVGSELVVYYLDADHHLQGVLMWNVWGDGDHDTKAIAAKLLADRRAYTAHELFGRI